MQKRSNPYIVSIPEEKNKWNNEKEHLDILRKGPWKRKNDSLLKEAFWVLGKHIQNSVPNLVKLLNSSINEIIIWTTWKRTD